jgi:membrane protein implicated in regulation of membrane protease activity
MEKLQIFKDVLRKNIGLITLLFSVYLLISVLSSETAFALKLITLTAVGVLAINPKSWLTKYGDKAAHFLIAFMICDLAMKFDIHYILWAALAVILLSILNEFLDRKKTGFSVEDLIAAVLGILFSIIVKTLSY